MRAVYDALAVVRLPTVFETICALLVLSAVLLLDIFVLKPLTSPLRNLPGPSGGRGMDGHSSVIMNLHGSTVHEWIEKYGTTFMVKGPFAVHHRLFTLDPRALSHVLNHSQIYFKSPLLRNLVRRYMKEGLIVAEGERHKIQRKVAQRLFSRNGLRGMSEAVEEKAVQLRDIFQNLIHNPRLTTPYSPSNETLPPGSREIDIYASTSRCTFDIIGQVGIDHTFDSTGDWEGEGGELFERYEKMQMPFYGWKFVIGLIFPWFERIMPSDNKMLVDRAMDPLEKLSQDIMRERQREIDEGKREAASDNRDLLTLMLRSNMTKGMTPDQKLRDDEITGQLATFMFAGSDTTAGTIAMGLYQLAKHPEIQDTLRAELLACGDNLPYDQIDELPYLDAVVKEVLRINPSLPGTVRQAQKDDIIPLSQPVKLTNGKIVNEIKIRKGQLIHIPIEHLHTSTHIWGEDAKVFNPSRFLGLNLEPTQTPSTATFPSFNSPWTSPSTPLDPIPESVNSSGAEVEKGDSNPKIVRRSSVPLSPMTPMFPAHSTMSERKSSTGDERPTQIYSPMPTPTTPKFDLSKMPRKTSIPTLVPPGPGVWPNFMTFIDGPRRCIGYKLALIEIKIMFFKLIRDFEITPKEDQKVWRWNMMSTRPYVEGTLHTKGSSLPIIFKQYKGDPEPDQTFHPSQ
ncbi:uncharacterized protein I303_103403 [Kwoniella dejecticola CBS 10117]|uniref:Cytochrome P450 n=1 Tax=Kwoniella dejecticola CBS 10117 TaxID=1296121 RepID=A0A1A6A6N4_9TREE|nr:cytochrome P450 [Kwoniella dejecticola CBS 10117]OBR85715.1 cytochrome P450 [Kwoniella dejecticola CBS 10117]